MLKKASLELTSEFYKNLHSDEIIRITPIHQIYPTYTTEFNSLDIPIQEYWPQGLRTLALGVEKIRHLRIKI